MQIVNGQVIILGGFVGTVNYRTANTKNGPTPVCTFGLQINEGQNAQPKWINVQCWREVADFANSIQKGDYAIAIGIPFDDEYNGKKERKLNANEVYCTRASHRNWQFMVDQLSALTNSLEGGNGYRGKPQQMQQLPNQQNMTDAFGVEALADDDETLPF